MILTTAEILDNAGNEIVDRLIDGIRKRRLSATKRLESSIRYEVTNNGNILSIYALEYIYTLVPPGRRPNRTNSGGLKDGIRNWIRSKPSVVPRDLTPSQFAFLVTRKIAKEGNLMFRQGPNRFNDGKLLDEAINQQIIDELLNLIVEDYKTEFRKIG